MQPAPVHPSGSQARRILVRGVNWLGDAVMTTPALLRLREHFRHAGITLLTPQKLADLWQRHPAIDDTLSFAPGEGVISVSQRLRSRKFDLALILPNSPRSALEAWLAAIPQRVGYARPWRNWFLTRPVPRRPGHARMPKRAPAEIRRLTTAQAGSPQAAASTRSGRESLHQVHDYLHLAAALGSNSAPVPQQLFVAPEEIQSAREKFGLEENFGPVFALNPGAEYGPAKRWPAEQFAAAAREIQPRAHCHWLILGGAADLALAAQIQSALEKSHPVRNLAGRTSLRELCALLKLSRVLLTNDTGPMHVAAALGTPVVALFGSTSPDLTGPGLPGETRHQLLSAGVPCSPCFLRECPIDFRCMNGISVARVVEAVLRVAQDK